MKRNVIKIEGREYPCRLTMGALLEYNRMTGKEATEAGGGDLTSIIALLYCCLLSSCRADGVELPYQDEMSMADHIVPDDLSAWQAVNLGTSTDACQSKSKKKE